MRKLKSVPSEEQAPLFPGFTSPRRANFVKAEPSTRIVLTEDEIFFDHCVFLEENLKVFKSNPSEREEILKWINSNDEGLYSFRLCAKFYGCDPDELAEGLRYIVRKHYNH